MGIGYDVRGIEQVVVWQVADGALVIEGSKPMLRARLHIVRLLPAVREIGLGVGSKRLTN